MTTDTVTLREHFEALLREMEKRNEQRFAAQEQAVTTALSAAKEAVNAAMAAAEKAVTKAESATEKRLENVNEFRQTLSDQMTTFVRQDVAKADKAGTDALIATLTAQIIENRGRGAGRNDIWVIIIAVAGPVIAIAALFLKH